MELIPLSKSIKIIRTDSHPPKIFQKIGMVLYLIQPLLLFYYTCQNVKLEVLIRIQLKKVTSVIL